MADQKIKVAASGYGDAGASLTKRALKGYKATSYSPREDIDCHNQTLRQRARTLRMSSPIAASAIDTNKLNIIGVGLKLDCNINRKRLGLSSAEADAWEQHTEEEFNLWAQDARSCDATGVNNFYALQALALACQLDSGDVFGLFAQRPSTHIRPYGTRIRLIEADRICTPTTAEIYGYPYATVGKCESSGNWIYDGVEVADTGDIVAYHICDQYPSSYNTELPKWTRVEAYGRFTELPNVVHVMGCERAGQYRGVPYLAPIIEQVLQLKRYSDAEVTAAVIQSFFTSFITNPSVAGDFSLSEAVPDEEDEASYASSDYEMGPGSIIELKPGQDVRFADPTRPSGRYTDFVGTVCEEIGAALGLPCELLLKRFNASYSASRAALLEAGKMFATRRKWFANTFCNPIYAVWLSEAVALGRIKAPGFFTDPLRRAAWLGASWVGPSQGQIDPVKEINSELAAINEGITTREQATIRLNGGSWTANMEQLAREEALLRSIRKEDKQIQSDFKPENEEEEQDDEKGGEEDARSKTKTEQ